MARPLAAHWSALLCCLAVVGQLGQHATAQAVAAPPADIPALPPLASLPDNCGSVRQVLPGDTCQSLADWGGISLAKFQGLNSLLLCNMQLPPGTPVCAGDTFSFCAQPNIFIAMQSDTCASIQQDAGTIVNIDGLKDTDCAELAVADDIPVCVNPDVAKCQRNTICAVPISAELQDLLAAQPDFCSILAECKALPELTTMQGKPSLTLTITSQTAEVARATASSGHPALASLAAAQAAGLPAALRVTLTPGWFADAGNSGQTRFEFGEVVSSGSNRKILGNSWIPRYYAPTGFMRVPRLHYYGRG